MKATKEASIELAKADLQYLIQDVIKPQEKAYLRMALYSYLTRMKHNPDVVTAILDEYFTKEPSA